MLTPDPSTREQAPGGGNNPNIFRPPSKSPKPSDGRKVAFSENVEDIDAYNASPKVPPKDAAPGGEG